MVKSNVKFIDRTVELGKLNDLLHKKIASMVVIKGRRRIGKTRLIEEFAKDKPFYILLVWLQSMVLLRNRNETNLLFN